MLRNRIPRNAVVRGPLSFLFRFLFFFSFRSIVASMEYVGARYYRRNLSDARYYRRKNYYRKKREERTMHQTRPFRTPRVRIYDVRISRVRISFASRERATRLMTETQEGGDPWWKKCRDSSRFYAFACDIQFTKWQSPSLARSRARKNLREEKGERATRSVPRKKS